MKFKLVVVNSIIFTMAGNLTFTTVYGEFTIASHLIQNSPSKFTMTSNLTFTTVNGQFTIASNLI